MHKRKKEKLELYRWRCVVVPKRNQIDFIKYGFSSCKNTFTHTYTLAHRPTALNIIYCGNSINPFFFSLICTSFSPTHRLFEDHGELLLLFNKFRELKTKEQQASSEELAEHANKVMETLDEGIRSLDELDNFFDYLHQVGASHTRIPDFKSEYFWVSIALAFPRKIHTTIKYFCLQIGQFRSFDWQLFDFVLI